MKGFRVLISDLIFQAEMPTKNPKDAMLAAVAR